MKYDECKDLQDGDWVLICPEDKLIRMTYAMPDDSFMRYANQVVEIYKCTTVKNPSGYAIQFRIVGAQPAWFYENNAIDAIVLSACSDMDFDIASDAELTEFLS